MSPTVTHGAELMSVTETATMLSLSRMTVLRRIKSGAWPGGKTGRKYLVHRPFAQALAAEIGSGRNVDAEGFAAAWMARNSAPVTEAVA